MSGISAIMNIANGALQASQIAMQLVSHNIANVNTPGYTRQSATLESESSVSMNRLKLGMGVQVDSGPKLFKLKTGIKEVNDLTQQIADLNEEIVAAEASKTTANDLRDQRSNLLEKLSGWVGNDYVERDNGSVIVMTKEGILLMDGDQHWELSTEGNSIHWNGIPNDISKKLTSGKIGGWLDVRDETVPQYKANLDELPGSLIHQVNTLHVNGYDLAGETGKYFFENLQTAPAVPNSLDYHDAAAYITLSSDVLDPPENIAAGGQSGAPGDNENARNIAALQTDNTIQIRKWAIAERGANTFSSLQTETMDNYYQDLVGEIGILKEECSQNQDFSQSMLDQLGQIRDSVSAVNLDEELTQMMKIPRAYEAASKMITVADDRLQSLLQLR